MKSVVDLQACKEDLASAGSRPPDPRRCAEVEGLIAIAVEGGVEIARAAAAAQEGEPVDSASRAVP